MPSFPNSVFSPATRSNGQTIDASHVNDVQNEIVAIEDGYLNGTARLNAGASTLASLSVPGGSTLATLTAGASTLASVNISGNSTLAGNLQVNGNSTFTGNVTVGGSVIANNVGNPPRVRVTNSANQDLTQDAWVGLSWDTEAYDSTGMHDTVVASSRVTFVSTGIFHVGANVLVNVGGSPTIVAARMLLNSTTELVRLTTDPGASTQWGLCLSMDARFATTTDYLTLEVFHNSASTCSAGVTSAFWAHRVST